MIITIDGPGGVGKSSLARKLAQHLGFEVLDTGAMFRAVAYYVVQSKLPLENLEAEDLLKNIDVSVEKGACLLDGKDISSEIRLPEIDRAASRVSTLPYVRRRMKGLQRAFAEGRSIVAEGRDMGSQIFPEAEFKFYLDASSEVRAERRRLQLLEKGVREPYEEILRNIVERDERDRTRSAAPLVVPQGARIIETDGLSLEEVFRMMLSAVKKMP